MSGRHGGRWGQRGQALVVLAFMMTVLLVITGLAVSGGNLYWERRQLQGFADASSLAGAKQLAGDCSPARASQAFTEVHRVLTLHLGAGSAGSITGDCNIGFTRVSTYPSGPIDATARYPYASQATQIEVSLSQSNTNLPFYGLLGTGNVNVPGRAVAKFGSATPQQNFAVYSRTDISCVGGGDWTVYGSMYSRDGLLGAAPSPCNLYTRAIRATGSSYLDFGNATVLSNTQAWGTARIQSDGFQWRGSTSVLCGGTPNAYQDNAQTPLPSALNPCPPSAGGVPDLPFPTYPNPNTTYHNVSQIYSPGTPRYTATPTCADAVVPGAPQPDGFYHVGTVGAGGACYGALKIPNGKTVFLEPGHYYFNGKGICLNDGGSNTDSFLLGKEVTLQFARGAAFTTAGCDTPTGATCGGGSNAWNCGIGNTRTLPAANRGLTPPQATTAWCTGPCPLKGLLIYSDSTGPLYLNGPGVGAYLQGSIAWSDPTSTCTYWTNGGALLKGQMACNRLRIDSAGPGDVADNSITFDIGAINIPPAEPGLVE
jgi:Flp pilus assembly protein TadG